MGVTWCLKMPLRKKVFPQGNSRGMSHEEHEVREPGTGVPIGCKQQYLLIVLPDLAQSLCKEAHWGEGILGETPGQAVHQCIHAERGLALGVGGNGRIPGKQTSQPVLPQIDFKLAEPPGDGFSILPGGQAVVRAHWLHG